MKGLSTDCLPFMPITMMFAVDQIGRKYYDYIMDHRVLVESQIRTAELYDIDHVSCISDPTREVVQCGGTVRFLPDQPAAIDEATALVADKATLARLKTPDPAAGRMLDRLQAAALFKQRVGNEKLIEGWIEGPMAMGADMRGINAVMLDFYDDPPFVRDLFEFAVAMELRFAKAQKEAGVDYMGIGDSATSLVGPALYYEFVWPYQKKLVDGLHAMGLPVRLHICGNTAPILEGFARLGCEILDLDSLVPMQLAREKLGPGQTVLGNIDPVRVLRNGSPETIRTAIAECHRQAGPRYVVGAGCEVPRDTKPENLHALREYARAHHP
jgi:MtaA/CmuA family methyltransferase